MGIAIFISLVFVFLFVDDLFSKKQSSASKLALNNSTGPEMPPPPSTEPYRHYGPHGDYYPYRGNQHPQIPFYSPDKRYIWDGQRWVRNDGGFGGGFVLGMVICIAVMIALYAIR